MEIVTPKIEVIVAPALVSAPGGSTVIEDYMSLDPTSTDAESLVEFSGRGCYESWDKPNPKTASNADYIQRTAFDMAHGSILEHANFTLRFSGVSRAWLTEMERHRHLSWSVVSQRYVDANTFGIVMPPAIRELSASDRHLWKIEMEGCFKDYDGWTYDLQDSGLPRKQAREAARSVLPNCTEVRGVVTGNLRAWSTILPLRAHPSADREMQEVSMLILDALEPFAPTVTSNIRRTIEES